MKLITQTLLASCLIAVTPAFAQDVVMIVKEVSAVDQVNTELGGLRKMINSVNRTLQEMKESGSLDMVQDLRNEVALLELKKESARRRSIILEARAAYYYDGWLNQIEGMENKDLRKKAEKRYSQVLKEYNKFVDLVKKGRADFVPYVSDVTDIIIYLDADPSEKALKSLSNTIWKLDSRSKALMKQIDGIVKQLTVAREAIPQK